MKKQKDGRYRKQVYIGMKESGQFDEAGQPILVKDYKSVYGKTKKEVEDKAAQLKVKIGKGINITTAKDSFKKWADILIADKEAEELSQSYIKQLKGACAHLESLYNLPICKIKIEQIKSIVADCATTVIDDKGVVLQKALSKRTLGGIKQFAKMTFDKAIEHRAIDFNPAIYVKVPKDAVKTVRTPISKEQQRWVVEFEHRAKRAAMIMLFAGLRRGEVGALTWDDIDFEEGYISVTKAVQMVDGQPVVKPPKTAAGVRTVDMPQILIDYLLSERNKDGCKYVFHNKDGNMLSKTTWRQVWESYLKDLNVEYGYTPNKRHLLGIPQDAIIRKNIPGGLPMQIERFTVHQLRHTFATNCYFADVPVEVCRDWMGHSSIKTTLEIYTHLSKQFKRQKSSRLDAYFSEQKIA